MWTVVFPHACLALAVQYLRPLSGSLIRPSRQQCEHANFIFMLRLAPALFDPFDLPPPPPEDSWRQEN